MIFSFIRNKTTNIKLSSNLKNGVIFSFFSFFNQGINFLVSMFLVTILTQEDFGNINLFNTFVIVLTTLIPLGTIAYVSTNFFIKNKNEIQEILSSIYVVSFLSLCTIFIIIFAGQSLLGPIIDISFPNQIIALVICYCQLFTTINLEMWRLQEKPIKYGLYTSGIVASNVILTLLFILKFDLGWMGRVYAILITNLTFFIISLCVLYKREWLVLFKINKVVVQKILFFGLPLVPHILTGWMRQGVDRYIINFFWDLKSVAIFSFAINLANIIQIAGLAFNASNSVFIFKALSNEKEDTYKKLFRQIKQMTLFFMIITIIIWGVSNIGISYFLAKYTDSIILLLPLCLSAFFQCIYLLFVNYLFFYKKTKRIMHITVGVSILHILTSLLFTKYSIICTAYVNLLSNFVICCLIIWAVRKEILHSRNKTHEIKT